MKLQAKLTLGSVALATVLVTGLSAVGLDNLMRLQFRHVLERAELIKSAATDAVIDTLNRERSKPLPDVLRDPTLNKQLVALLTSYKAILDITLVSADTNETLASALGASHAGSIPDFAPLVRGGSSLQQLRVLMRQEPQSYKLDEPVGPGGVTQLYVRVLVNPALIRDDLKPTLEGNALVAILAIAGIVLITFLASAIAFRPLGRISHMLDL